jgi:predicted pyridoxine 5'-phosphate oxidase superfamily flavin-nucleotide-binding protein
MSVFHEGEIAVQAKAGVRHQSERVGNGIHSEIPDAAQEFLLEQPFVVIGATDPETGNVWASILFGSPGFAHPVDERTVYLAAVPALGDPLQAALSGKAFVPIGLLAIEPATRSRMRLNGTSEAVEGGLLVHAAQVYANCPKYIQRRDFTQSETSESGGTPAVQGDTLTPAQAVWIERVDTFFIASAHPTVARMLLTGAAIPASSGSSLTAVLSSSPTTPATPCLTRSATSPRPVRQVCSS